MRSESVRELDNREFKLVLEQLAAERYNKPDPVNLGSSEELSIRELASLVVDLVGFGGEVVCDTSKPDGQPRRKLDTTEARKEFGFVAKTKLLEGLRRTVEWYQQVRVKA